MKSFLTGLPALLHSSPFRWNSRRNGFACSSMMPTTFITERDLFTAMVTVSLKTFWFPMSNKFALTFAFRAEILTVRSLKCSLQGQVWAPASPFSKHGKNSLSKRYINKQHKQHKQQSKRIDAMKWGGTSIKSIQKHKNTEKPTKKKINWFFFHII